MIKLNMKLLDLFFMLWAIGASDGFEIRVPSTSITLDLCFLFGNCKTPNTNAGTFDCRDESQQEDYFSDLESSTYPPQCYEVDTVLVPARSPQAILPTNPGVNSIDQCKRDCTRTYGCKYWSWNEGPVVGTNVKCYGQWQKQGNYFYRVTRNQTRDSQPQRSQNSNCTLIQDLASGAFRRSVPDAASGSVLDGCGPQTLTTLISTPRPFVPKDPYGSKNNCECIPVDESDPVNGDLVGSGLIDVRSLLVGQGDKGCPDGEILSCQDDFGDQEPFVSGRGFFPIQ